MTNERLKIILPFPPSVNGYWRAYKSRTILSKRGRDYQKAALFALAAQRVPRFGKARVSVTVTLYPPNRARRDIDNYLKAPLDALTKAGLWADDEQIDRLCVERAEVTPGGRVEVEVQKL